MKIRIKENAVELHNQINNTNPDKIHDKETFDQYHNVLGQLEGEWVTALPLKDSKHFVINHPFIRQQVIIDKQFVAEEAKDEQITTRM